ncbi:MAG: hypothetical protein IT372_42435 [Polyangiaceae bacterium]|nr:hypothetical protein [Polyangiaceae bacterium]
MKKILGSLLVLGTLSGALMGCGYGSMVAIGTDKVVILRNDGFLFGALRKAFVCKVAENGLASCGDNESP